MKFCFLIRLRSLHEALLTSKLHRNGDVFSVAVIRRINANRQIDQLGWASAVINGYCMLFGGSNYRNVQNLWDSNDRVVDFKMHTKYLYSNRFCAGLETCRATKKIKYLLARKNLIFLNKSSQKPNDLAAN